MEKKEDVSRTTESFEIVLPLCFMVRINQISQRMMSDIENERYLLEGQDNGYPSLMGHPLSQ